MSTSTAKPATFHQLLKDLDTPNTVEYYEALKSVWRAVFAQENQKELKISGKQIVSRFADFSELREEIVIKASLCILIKVALTDPKFFMASGIENVLLQFLTSEKRKDIVTVGIQHTIDYALYLASILTNTISANLSMDHPLIQRLVQFIKSPPVWLTHELFNSIKKRKNFQKDIEKSVVSDFKKYKQKPDEWPETADMSENGLSIKDDDVNAIDEIIRRIESGDPPTDSDPPPNDAIQMKQAAGAILAPELLRLADAAKNDDVVKKAEEELAKKQEERRQQEQSKDPNEVKDDGSPESLKSVSLQPVLLSPEELEQAKQNAIITAQEDLARQKQEQKEAKRLQRLSLEKEERKKERERREREKRERDKRKRLQRDLDEQNQKEDEGKFADRLRDELFQRRVPYSYLEAETTKRIKAETQIAELLERGAFLSNIGAETREDELIKLRKEFQDLDERSKSTKLRKMNHQSRALTNQKESRDFSQEIQEKRKRLIEHPSQMKKEKAKYYTMKASLQKEEEEQMDVLHRQERALDEREHQIEARRQFQRKSERDEELNTDLQLQSRDEWNFSQQVIQLRIDDRVEAIRSFHKTMTTLHSQAKSLIAQASIILNANPSTRIQTSLSHINDELETAKHWLETESRKSRGVVVKSCDTGELTLLGPDETKSIERLLAMKPKTPESEEEEDESTFVHYIERWTNLFKAMDMEGDANKMPYGSTSHSIILSVSPLMVSLCCVIDAMQKTSVELKMCKERGGRERHQESRTSMIDWLQRERQETEQDIARMREREAEWKTRKESLVQQINEAQFELDELTNEYDFLRVELTKEKKRSVELHDGMLRSTQSYTAITSNLHNTSHVLSSLKEENEDLTEVARILRDEIDKTKQELIRIRHDAAKRAEEVRRQLDRIEEEAKQEWRDELEAKLAGKPFRPKKLKKTIIDPNPEIREERWFNGTVLSIVDPLPTRHSLISDLFTRINAGTTLLFRHSQIGGDLNSLKLTVLQPLPPSFTIPPCPFTNFSQIEQVLHRDLSTLFGIVCPPAELTEISTHPLSVLHSHTNRLQAVINHSPIRTLCSIIYQTAQTIKSNTSSNGMPLIASISALTLHSLIFSLLSPFSDSSTSNKHFSLFDATPLPYGPFVEEACQYRIFTALSLIIPKTNPFLDYPEFAVDLSFPLTSIYSVAQVLTDTLHAFPFAFLYGRMSSFILCFNLIHSIQSEVSATASPLPPHFQPLTYLSTSAHIPAIFLLNSGVRLFNLDAAMHPVIRTNPPQFPLPLEITGVREFDMNIHPTAWMCVRLALPMFHLLSLSASTIKVFDPIIPVLVDCLLFDDHVIRYHTLSILLSLFNNGVSAMTLYVHQITARIIHYLIFHSPFTPLPPAPHPSMNMKHRRSALSTDSLFFLPPPTLTETLHCVQLAFRILSVTLNVKTESMFESMAFLTLLTAAVYNSTSSLVQLQVRPPRSISSPPAISTTSHVSDEDDEEEIEEMMDTHPAGLTQPSFLYCLTASTNPLSSPLVTTDEREWNFLLDTALILVQRLFEFHRLKSCLIVHHQLPIHLLFTASCSRLTKQTHTPLAISLLHECIAEIGPQKIPITPPGKKTPVDFDPYPIFKRWSRRESGWMWIRSLMDTIKADGIRKAVEINEAENGPYIPSPNAFPRVVLPPARFVSLKSIPAHKLPIDDITKIQLLCCPSSLVILSQLALIDASKEQTIHVLEVMSSVFETRTAVHSELVTEDYLKELTHQDETISIQDDKSAHQSPNVNERELSLSQSRFDYVQNKSHKNGNDSMFLNTLQSISSMNQTKPSLLNGNARTKTVQRPIPQPTIYVQDHKERTTSASQAASRFNLVNLPWILQMKLRRFLNEDINSDGLSDSVLVAVPVLISILSSFAQSPTTSETEEEINQECRFSISRCLSLLLQPSSGNGNDPHHIILSPSLVTNFPSIPPAPLTSLLSLSSGALPSPSFSNILSSFNFSASQKIPSLYLDFVSAVTSAAPNQSHTIANPNSIFFYNWSSQSDHFCRLVASLMPPEISPIHPSGQSLASSPTLPSSLPANVSYELSCYIENAMTPAKSNALVDQLHSSMIMSSINSGLIQQKRSEHSWDISSLATLFTVLIHSENEYCASLYPPSDYQQNSLREALIHHILSQPLPSEFTASDTNPSLPAAVLQEDSRVQSTLHPLNSMSGQPASAYFTYLFDTARIFLDAKDFYSTHTILSFIAHLLAPSQSVVPQAQLTTHPVFLTERTKTFLTAHEHVCCVDPIQISSLISVSECLFIEDHLASLFAFMEIPTEPLCDSMEQLLCIFDTYCILSSLLVLHTHRIQSHFLQNNLDSDAMIQALSLIPKQIIISLSMLQKKADYEINSLCICRPPHPFHLDSFSPIHAFHQPSHPIFTTLSLAFSSSVENICPLTLVQTIAITAVSALATLADAHPLLRSAFFTNLLPFLDYLAIQHKFSTQLNPEQRTLLLREQGLLGMVKPDDPFVLNPFAGPAEISELRQTLPTTDYRTLTAFLNFYTPSTIHSYSFIQQMNISLASIFLTDPLLLHAVSASTFFSDISFPLLSSLTQSGQFLSIRNVCTLLVTVLSHHRSHQQLLQTSTIRQSMSLLNSMAPRLTLRSTTSPGRGFSQRSQIEWSGDGFVVVDGVDTLTKLLRSVSRCGSYSYLIGRTRRDVEGKKVPAVVSSTYYANPDSDQENRLDEAIKTIVMKWNASKKTKATPRRSHFVQANKKLTETHNSLKNKTQSPKKLRETLVDVVEKYLPTFDARGNTIQGSNEYIDELGIFSHHDSESEADPENETFRDGEDILLNDVIETEVALMTLIHTLFLDDYSTSLCTPQFTKLLFGRFDEAVKTLTELRVILFDISEKSEINTDPSSDPDRPNTTPPLKPDIYDLSYISIPSPFLSLVTPTIQTTLHHSPDGSPENSTNFHFVAIESAHRLLYQVRRLCHVLLQLIAHAIKTTLVLPAVAMTMLRTIRTYLGEELMIERGVRWALMSFEQNSPSFHQEWVSTTPLPLLSEQFPTHTSESFVLPIIHLIVTGGRSDPDILIQQGLVPFLVSVSKRTLTSLLSHKSGSHLSTQTTDHISMDFTLSSELLITCLSPPVFHDDSDLLPSTHNPYSIMSSVPQDKKMVQAARQDCVVEDGVWPLAYAINWVAEGRREMRSEIVTQPTQFIENSMSMLKDWLRDEDQENAYLYTVRAAENVLPRFSVARIDGQDVVGLGSGRVFDTISPYPPILPFLCSPDIPNVALRPPPTATAIGLHKPSASTLNLLQSPVPLRTVLLSIADRNRPNVNVTTKAMNTALSISDEVERMISDTRMTINLLPKVKPSSFSQISPPVPKSSTLLENREEAYAAPPPTFPDGIGDPLLPSEFKMPTFYRSEIFHNTPLVVHHPQTATYQHQAETTKERKHRHRRSHKD
ncbi:hypothetical protein BLNAU_318 [Blattamonas nauphoetae]|uniref:Uncharacterized protein n=1 Tax=Blattamonas nauphoetae TaxID=2049346 RepID=A0ABQ9YKY3_9EUKA|nr:hypothetical protein BLNAU_318 [Blattamonas nauphoetae]